jgi:acyl-CoA thioesterase
MPEASVRARLEAAIQMLDENQQQRLLDWAGAIQTTIPNARAAGTSIGPLADMLHIRNNGASGGKAQYQLDVAPEMLNPHGVLHGGAVYVMVDYSMGAATMAVLPSGEICATIEIKISYLAGVRGGTLTCDTSIIKQGRRVVFLESRVVDGSGKIVATATGSFAVFRPGE